MAGQKNSLMLFILISKHRMISHYLPKLMTCVGSLNSEQIWSKESDDSNSVGGIILHVMEHLKRNTERVFNPSVRFDSGIEEYFPDRMDDKTHLMDEISLAFEEFEKVMSTANSEEVDMHSIYHLVEHTGYHLGQIVERSQKMSNKKFDFVRNGINEKALRLKIEEEIIRGKGL